MKFKFLLLLLFQSAAQFARGVDNVSLANELDTLGKLIKYNKNLLTKIEKNRNEVKFNDNRNLFCFVIVIVFVCVFWFCFCFCLTNSITTVRLFERSKTANEFDSDRRTQVFV